MRGTIIPVFGLLAAVLTLPQAVLAAGPGSPSVDEVVQQATTAAGGDAQLAKLRFLEVAVSSQETTSGGETHLGHYKATIAVPGLASFRLELPPKVVLGSTPGKSWATVDGKLDTRRSARFMAEATIHEKLFPALLPFSLAMGEVKPSDVEPAQFEGTPVWKLKVPIPRNFFASPVLVTDWDILIDRKDGRVLAAQFIPPVEYRTVQGEGMRFRYQKMTKVGGCTLPSEILIEGVDPTGRATNHFSVLNLSWEPKDREPPETFLDPKTLEQINEGLPVQPH